MSQSASLLDRFLEGRFVLSLDQVAQFDAYYRLLLKWNEKMNLTTITEEKEVVVKHFYDSLTPAFYLDFLNVQKMMDVGTGAGFPAIPLKILFPHLQVTLLDSSKKRLCFLKAVVDELGLSLVTLVHGRAEDIGRNSEYREVYDLVVARAVAHLNVLCEYCLPFVRVGGSFVALKGVQGFVEVEKSQTALQCLGGGVPVLHHLNLPEERGQRVLICVRKEKPTPRKYPRKAGIPSRSPIVQKP